MPIVQISKIIHRTGADDDLPQLDTGEIGFSTDERRVYIGNDPILHPPLVSPTTETEILTDASTNIRIEQVSNFIVAAPTASDDPGTKGQISYDASYLYVCVDTDTWVRASLASW